MAFGTKLSRSSKVTAKAPVRCVAVKAQARDVRGALAAFSAAAVLAAAPVYAELNAKEAAAGGEFGMGTAQQFGEATAKDQDFSNQVGPQHVARPVLQPIAHHTSTLAV